MLSNDVNYFVANITDEDLEVTEKWLIKVSVVNDCCKDEETGDALVSRKLVYELIQKLTDDDEALELGFEVAKLPVLYFSKEQIKELREVGRFEKYVYKDLSMNETLRNAGLI